MTQTSSEPQPSTLPSGPLLANSGDSSPPEKACNGDEGRGDLNAATREKKTLDHEKKVKIYRIACLSGLTVCIIILVICLGLLATGNLVP